MNRPVSRRGPSWPVHALAEAGGPVPQPWTEGAVVRLKVGLARGDGMTSLAHRSGHSIAEVDLMLWVMIGRTVREAVAVANRRIDALED